MSNYSKTTDFAAKDSLPSGDSGKIIRGSEFETEFDNISTAIATKADAADPTFTGTVTIDGLTVNGNTVLGNAATDTVTVTADIASNLIPSADDTYNLGASGAEWNDLFIDGTANIDSLVADTADINGGTIDGVTIGGSSAGAITGTAISGTSFASTGNMTFGDNDKAIFGAGSDLQIYHSGSHSVIEDSGTGNLFIKGTNLSLRDADGNDYITMVDGGSGGTVSLLHLGSTKLATTSTGIDITGTVVSDGLTSSGNLEISNTVPLMDFMESDQTDKNTRLVSTNGDFEIRTLSDNKATQTTRFSVDNPTGDISFYEDTGTTAKFFWDASAERLGLGTSSPGATLDVDGTLDIAPSSGDAQLKILNSADTGRSLIYFSDPSGTGGRMVYNHASNFMSFETNGTNEAMRIDSSGNVGIGTQTVTNSTGYQRTSINGSNGGILEIKSSDTPVARFLATGGSAQLATLTAIPLLFNTNGSERMRIHASGNVGIGTSSPGSALEVVGRIATSGGSADIQSNLFGAGDGSATNPSIRNIGDSDTGFWFPAANTIGFSTGGSEAMRIDSSGNLLVGKTSGNTLGTPGVEIDGNLNRIMVTRDDQVPMFLNRNSTNGIIQEFRKDNSTVGNIGTISSTLYVAGNDKGVRFTTTQMLPCTNSGTNSDGAVDLGASVVRWKDLYLSGGAYLGGTAAANKLDDYEEGTWTPAASNAQGFTLGTPTGASGQYTKVGQLVTVECGFTSLDSTETVVAGDRFEITGLPFAPSGNYTSATASVGSCVIYASYGSGVLATGTVTHSGSTLVVIVDNAFSSVTFSTDVNIAISYITTS